MELRFLTENLSSTSILEGLIRASLEGKGAIGCVKMEHEEEGFDPKIETHL